MVENRKKVIEQLESMRDYHRSVGNNITADIANDALELLKEQADQIERLEHDLAVTQNNLNYYVNGND